jgi:hypothetical protein
MAVRAYAFLGPSKLFNNLGDGTFVDVAPESGLAAIDVYPLEHRRNSIRVVTWFDADNDGDLDLFFVRSNDWRDVADPGDLLYRNELKELGTATFTDITAEAGVGGRTDGGGDGAAWADYDNDGFLDLVVGNGNEPSWGYYQLFHNRGNHNHWLKVRLHGTRSNKGAIGSRVWIDTGGDLQYREYLDHGLLHCQNEQVAHFGLGAATRVDVLRVQWPDGRIQQWTDVAADQTLDLTEPTTALHHAYLPLVQRQVRWRA